MPMKAPAFSLDYFPSREVAWSLFKESKVVVGAVSVPSGTPNSVARLDYFGNRITTYGSAGSSNGLWERDRELMMPHGPQTPYSTGNTPPGIISTRSHRNSTINSLSTSPEQRVAKRTNSNLSVAFSSFSRPFTALGTSPDRYRSDADLSTSAPTSGITWGSNTFFSSSSNSPEKRRRDSSRRCSFKTHDSTYSSDEEDYWLEDSDQDDVNSSPLKDSTTPTIKTIFKNQNQFEEESHASLPLLPQPHQYKYQAYRAIYADQLSIWGLYIQRAEILKFNGLTNYWPIEMSTNQQSSSASKQGNVSASPNAPTFPVPIPSSDRAATVAREQSIYGTTTPTLSTSYTSFTSNMFLPSIHPLTDPVATGEMRNKMLEHPSILARAWKTGESPLATTERLRISCCWCNELVDGVYVTCPTFVHRAHWKCHDTWRYNTRHSEQVDRGVAGCGCAGHIDLVSSVDAATPEVKVAKPVGEQ